MSKQDSGGGCGAIIFIILVAIAVEKIWNMFLGAMPVIIAVICAAVAIKIVSAIVKAVRDSADRKKAEQEREEAERIEEEKRQEFLRLKEQEYLLEKERRETISKMLLQEQLLREKAENDRYALERFMVECNAYVEHQEEMKQYESDTEKAPS